MKKHTNLSTFLTGICVGITGIIAYLVLTGNLPFIKAAGVGTGAPDINAMYLDGYTTSLSAGANKIYISGANNYLPANTVASSTIVDNSITSAKIADGTIIGCSSDMVSVGGFCIDKYEASVWSTASGGTQYGATADDYPCSDTGNDCSQGAANPIYARSISGVNPARYITWFQAVQACANVGKYLCTNAEWQTAAAGTPDPHSTDPGDDSEPCNIWTNSKPSAATWATTNETIQTGSAPNCQSNWGAYDMVGNVWEWTADWWGADSATNGLLTNTTYGSDYMYDVDPADAQGGGQNFPAASRRGGHWGNGSGAGVFALTLDGAPSYSSNSVGFRCCR